MADKLDRSRDFAMVYGDPKVRFSQDGKSYRADGTLYIENAPEPPKEIVVVAAPEPETVKQRRDRNRAEAMKRYWEKKKARATQ